MEQDIVIRRLIFIGYDFSKHMGKKNISAFAASTAFFLFLSLIPMLMLLRVNQEKEIKGSLQIKTPFSGKETGLENC